MARTQGHAQTLHNSLTTTGAVIPAEAADIAVVEERSIAAYMRTDWRVDQATGSVVAAAAV